MNDPRLRGGRCERPLAGERFSESKVGNGSMSDRRLAAFGYSKATIVPRHVEAPQQQGKLPWSWSAQLSWLADSFSSNKSRCTPLSF